MCCTSRVMYKQLLLYLMLRGCDSACVGTESLLSHCVSVSSGCVPRPLKIRICVTLYVTNEVWMYTGHHRRYGCT